MTKVNFGKIIIKNIEGNDMPVDVRPVFGNLLYMQGENIEECELGSKIYHSDGDIEIDEKQVDIVKSYAKRLPYVTRQAICDSVETKK